MTQKAILSSKGQVVIPKELRSKLGLHSGSELVIKLRNDAVLELKPLHKSIKNFFGKGKKRALGKKIDVDLAIAQTVKDNDRN